MIKYREKKIRSVKELNRTIEGLEPDEGLRIIGSLQGFSKGGFVFITKPSERYCVNICERVFDRSLKAIVPGGKEEWFYASTSADVWSLIETRIKRPLEAWLY